jgi:hypothetical protein
VPPCGGLIDLSNLGAVADHAEPLPRAQVPDLTSIAGIKLNR